MNFELTEPRIIQKTSITVHEEGRTDTGALKVIWPEKLEGGRFRIIYRGLAHSEAVRVAEL